MSGPTLHLTYPPASFFKFPPDPLPEALPPPSEDATFASPFAIDATRYNRLLDFKFPATFALSYILIVTALNAINARRQHKPWAISRTRIFRTFVLLHNVALAVFSALTFLGMLRAIRHTWPGLHSEGGLVEAVDALCKMHGPRGFGDAAIFNATTATWETKNKAIHLGDFGKPDPTDYGRLWNEGLAFWGWLFYLSKFYEVVDTAIILAKGKRSSFLQMYHHAGAMLCMWAGIRYMSPPIWMFVTVNSALHALMYTYYALTGLGYRIPQTVKGTLTTLQILQFVVGTAYAAAHLFVSYTVPVSIPYTFYHAIQDTVSSVSAVVATNIDSVIASATEQAGWAMWLKKMAFRAAGEEGLAENVRNERGETFGMEPPTLHAPTFHEPLKPRQETRYRNEYQTVNCLDTSGQAFAIYLNLIYLVPLTYLFIRFFIRSYSRRTSAGNRQRHPHRGSAVLEASKDATKGVETRFGKLTNPAEEGIKRLGNKFPETSGHAKELDQNRGRGVEKSERNMHEDNEVRSASPVMESTRRFAMEITQAAEEEMEKAKREARKLANQGGSQAQDVAMEITQAAEEEMEKAIREARKLADKGGSQAQHMAEKTREFANGMRERTAEIVQSGKHKAKDTSGDVSDRAQELGKNLKQEGKNLAEDAQDRASEAAEHFKESSQGAKDNFQEKAGNASQAVKQESQSVTEDVREKASDTKNDAKKFAKESKQDAKGTTEETEEDIVDSYSRDDGNRAEIESKGEKGPERSERKLADAAEVTGEHGRHRLEHGAHRHGQGVHDAHNGRGTDNGRGTHDRHGTPVAVLDLRLGASSTGAVVEVTHGRHGSHDIQDTQDRHGTHASHGAHDGRGSQDGRDAHAEDDTGLSSTSPKDLGESYAEVVKHHLAESDSA